MHSLHCPNCQATIAEKSNFCVNCGQKTNLHRLTIGHIAHDVIHFFLHADKSIFTLVKKLATQTGTVSKEFIAGKRKKYFPPLNFFLIVVGFVVLSMSFFKPLQAENDNTTQVLQAMATKITDPVKKAKLLGFIKRQANVVYFTKKYSNILAMCALPLISFIFYLCYRRNKYNYAEHLVANLYAVGFTSLVLAIVIIPLSSLAGIRTYFTLLAIFFLFEITYRVIYYVNLMGKKSALGVLKVLGVSLLAQLIWITLTISMLVWYIKSGISGLFA